MNLKRETKDVLKGLNCKLSELEWWGSANFGYSTDWKLFEKLADKEYDKGYGAQEVATDLIIVFKDFYLAREEYDGSEWWEDKSKRTAPKKPKKSVDFKGLFIDESKGTNCGWETLQRINEAHNGEGINN